MAAYHGKSIQIDTTAASLIQVARQDGHDISTRISANALKAHRLSTTCPWDYGFTYVRSWLGLFKELNPGSVIDLGTIRVGEVEIFDSLFFMSGSQAHCAPYCKPLCGLDGGHLKTALWNGYIVIVACTKDGNNRDVLIALYLCNVENTVNMASILSLMKEDAQVRSWMEQENFVFPVDRAACIKAAIYSQFPNALVRDCAKHAERNVNATPADKPHFWKYIHAKSESSQAEAMQALEVSNPAAAHKLKGITKELICNYNFPGFNWNEVTNNCSERGIKSLTHANRKLPLVAMLKAVMSANMKLCDEKRKKDAKWVLSSQGAKLCEYAKLKFDVSTYKGISEIYITQRATCGVQQCNNLYCVPYSSYCCICRKI